MRSDICPWICPLTVWAGLGGVSDDSSAPLSRARIPRLQRIRGEIYDAVHAALAPCRADPRAWADHRYAAALFGRAEFAKLFPGPGSLADPL